MVDLRKCIFALAIVALALGSAVTASAQVGAPVPGFTCTVNAGVTPLLRAEGLTELTGDIQLNCTGGAPTAAGLQVPQVNIQVFLNTNLTSRLYSNGGMEALLMIDEPQPGQQRPCGSLNGCTIPGNPTATTATLPAGPIGTGVDYRTGSFLSGESTIGIPNIYQGRQAGANAVVFLGVPIDPPGTAGTRQVRITNLRSNANQLGVSSTLVPTQVVAFISASPPQLMGINNPQQTVGFVAPGMNFSLRNAANSGGLRSAGAAFLQCVSFNPDAAGDVAKALQASPADAAVARFEEGFATAFKVRTVGPSGANANLTLTQDAQADLGEGAPAAQDIPGAQYNSESGFYAPLLTYPAGAGVRQPGLADQGTRLMLRFANVQAGVSLFVPLTQVAGTGNLLVRLVTTDASGAGPYSPTASTTTGTLISTSGVPVAPVTISGGTGVAVYEVVRSNTSIVERVDIPIVIAFKANTSANLPALGTSTVTGSFAPVSQVGTASETAAIPRFADTPTTRNLAIIAACSTNLLFPFVTNQAGFDTGMAISNTSQDPFGTSPQAGACKINYYGTTTGGGAAPAAQTSTTIAAGSQLTFVLSTGGTNGITGTPGFQGYIIAQCAFQYAHGFAFITDGPIGQARVAEGYLALVMDDGIGSRTGFASEVLAH